MQQVTCFFLLFIILASSYSLKAQQHNLPVPVTTEINTGLTKSQYEFSALAKWKDKILLIPQNRKTVVDSVFMIDSSEIAESLQKNTITPYTAFTIHNLRHTGSKKDSLFVHNILLSNYDGIEAAVTKQDTIFFSLETNISFGYIIKGVIDPATRSINILPDILHIPNTYIINNAGYESLAWLPGRDALMALFECNKDTINAKAFVFGSSLKEAVKPVEWKAPLYFRLADVYALNDNELIGINHLFTLQRNHTERDDYLESIDLKQAKAQLTNGGNMDTCFTQIIKLSFFNNTLSWQPVIFVSLDCSDNYEGIVPFNEGILMVVDGEPGHNSGKLVYVPLQLK